jgi:nickel/cobalt exporter
MKVRTTFRGRIRQLALLAAAAALLSGSGPPATAHPLGNFTINQFARVVASPTGAAVHLVVDMAEIPTLQAAREVDANGDGTMDAAEVDAYAARIAPEIASRVACTVGGVPAAIKLRASRGESRDGDGGLPVLRLEYDLDARVAEAPSGGRFRFENANFPERLGWREIVLAPAPGSSVFDATAFGTSLSDELHAYPEEMLMAPLDERAAEFSVVAGAPPAGSAALRARDGAAVVVGRDRFAELIAVPELTLGTALLGLLLAAGLGAVHAMSPGHGKTVVGAYLVGSRGTARHAAFLGLTVTITHTAGVFLLGLVALLASELILPERLFPVLSVGSGLIVLTIGLGLFVKRLRALLGVAAEHHHHHHHDHEHGDHSHDHLPPGAKGDEVTWRSLLALGISGGLLPCPSALVVLLAAIALGRVAYGLLLVVAFSVGLAGVLMAVGLAFVYAGRLVGGRLGSGPLVRAIPVASALVIACVGAAIVVEALSSAGFSLHLFELAEEPSFQGIGALGVLGLGLVYGLKHATEADHVVAVSTIVSEHGKLARAALVGVLWGMGHTASLLVVGAVVILLRVAIPETVASWLEFGVALMIIGLGAAALVRGLRGRDDVHIHTHAHDGFQHAHVHFHDGEAPHAAPVPAHSHETRQIGIKPVVVGAVHGLAGSAALTLLVLTEIPSPGLGILYLLVFGVGSVGGMLLMSGLVGVPFAFSAGATTRFHHRLQVAAGTFSVLFGFWYAYETGAIDGLLAVVLR